MTPTWSVETTRVPAPFNPALFGFAPGQQRQPIQSTDPFRLSVAKIWCFAPNNPNPVAAGTGVFVEQDVLLTVGHVVFDPRQFGRQRAGGYVEKVTIESAWLGIANVATSRVVAAPGWVASPNNAGNDLGVIKLNSVIVHSTPIAPQAIGDGGLSGQAISVYGFPSVDTHLFNAPGRCLALASDLIFHDADVEDGESGSPLLAGTTLAGLHRAGPGSTPTGFPDSVSAFRFTPQAIAWASGIFPRL